VTDEPAFRIVAVPHSMPACIECDGELDLHAADELDAALLPIRNDVIVDCTSVTFIDAAAIGILVRHHVRLRQEGHTVRVEHLTGFPRRVLKMVDLLGAFSVRD
jgi:anti-anti-sigma factor